MQLIRNANIKSKLVFLTVSAVLIGLGASCTAFVLQDLRTLKQLKKQQVGALAEVLGANAIAAIEFDDQQTAVELLSSLKEQPSVEMAALYNANNQLFAVWNAVDSASPPPAAPPKVGEQFTECDCLEVARRNAHEITSRILPDLLS